MERAVSGTSISHLIAPGASDFETKGAATGTGGATRRGGDTGDAFASLLHNKATTPQGEHKTGSEEGTLLSDMAENGIAWVVPHTAPVPPAPEMVAPDSEMQVNTEQFSEVPTETIPALQRNVAPSINVGEVEVPGGTPQAATDKLSSESFGFTPRMPSFGPATTAGAEIGVTIPPDAEPDHSMVAARQMPLTVKPTADKERLVADLAVEQTGKQKQNGAPDTKVLGEIFTARPDANRALPAAAFTVRLSEPVDPGQMPRETLANIDALTAQVRADAARAAAAPADTRPVRQIAEAVQHAASNGRDSLTLRLFPEELGEVDISLRMSDGLLKISIAAARPETLMLLQNNHQMLSRTLGDLGFADSATQFEFTERQDRSGDSDKQHNGRSARPSLDNGAAEPAQMSYRIDGAIDIRL
jgi:hypothetical protein